LNFTHRRWAYQNLYKGRNISRADKRGERSDGGGKKGGYVVGYGALAVYRSASSDPRSDRIEFAPLNKKTQIELIKMARASIDFYLKHHNMPQFEPTSDVMLEKRGVFVTLTENGYLRGCIGHHESNVPLYKLVPQMAVAAGFQDPRFPPLQPQEMGNIKIKVSVYLTNVYKIESIDEFEMGVHGIIMRKGRHAATYLPEVPVEAGWKTVDEEMTHLCQKAGLPSDGWKNGAEFWLYRTQVFDESILLH
jgi:AmmeMemoRadiSam system protein A